MRGRPKKPQGEVRGKTLLIRLTDEEHAVLTEAAKMRSLQLSSWVRSEILETAKRLLEKKR